MLVIPLLLKTQSLGLNLYHVRIPSNIKVKNTAVVMNDSFENNQQ